MLFPNLSLLVFLAFQHGSLTGASNTPGSSKPPATLQGTTANGSAETYDERLTLRPLSDGKVYSEFEYTLAGPSSIVRPAVVTGGNLDSTYTLHINCRARDLTMRHG